MVTGLDTKLLIYLWGIDATQPDLQFLSINRYLLQGGVVVADGDRALVLAT